MKRMSRGAIFWGTALITTGLVILLVQQGYIDQQVLSNAGQWWPLLLIGAGLAVIFAGVLGAVSTALAGVLVGVMVGALISGGGSFPTTCGDTTAPVGPLDDGSFDGSGADVVVDLSCITLEISGGSGSDWAVAADEASAPNLEVTAESDHLGLRTSEGVVGFEGRRHVALTVPGDDGTNLDVSTNAGEGTFDLSDGRWGRVELTGNASSTSVDLSDAELDSLVISLNAGSASVQLSDGTTVGSVEFAANAGSIDVCAPAGVGLKVTMGSDIAVGHNLDDEGFAQDGDTWTSDGYTSAATQIEISFSGNAASFSVNPEGGCS
jgi:hypothetical protein